MRKEFEMTQPDFNRLLERINGARNTPLIALQCGMPESPQQAANSAWCALGDKMGFDGMSVEPSDKGQLFFTAETKAWIVHPPAQPDTLQEIQINGEQIK